MSWFLPLGFFPIWRILWIDIFEKPSDEITRRESSKNTSSNAKQGDLRLSSKYSFKATFLLCLFSSKLKTENPFLMSPQATNEASVLEETNRFWKWLEEFIFLFRSIKN